MAANPKIRPFKTDDGYEYYVAVRGPEHVPRSQDRASTTVNKRRPAAREQRL